MDSNKFKKLVCNKFASLVAIDGFEKSDVIFFTAVGTIKGKPILKDDPDSSAKYFSEVALALAGSKDSDPSEISEEDKEFPNAIMLKNVEVISTGGNTLHIPAMILFVDQIIGVSYGNR